MLCRGWQAAVGAIAEFFPVVMRVVPRGAAVGSFLLMESFAMTSKFALKALVVALSFAAGAAANAATPTVARPTRLAQGDAVAGPLALSQPMHIVVGLKLQNKAELDAYISKRGFKPLTGAQFVARYSPSQAQAQAVVNFLKQSGFTNVKIRSEERRVGKECRYQWRTKQ